MYFSQLTAAFLALTTLGCSLFITQRVYLIPDGMEGDVYIFRDIKGAERLEQSGSTVTFQIPQSGFLISPFVPDELPFIPTYYYVKNDGSRTRLEFEPSSLHRTEENLKNPNPFVWFPRDVSSGFSGVSCEVKYEQFYVGTRPGMLSRNHESRENDWARFKEFVEKNAAVLCDGKPKNETTTQKKPAE